jgi:hypothetical protein
VVEERFGQSGVLLLEERVGAVMRRSQSGVVEFSLLVHHVLERKITINFKGCLKSPYIHMCENGMKYCKFLLLKVYFHFLNLDMPILRRNRRKLACSTT